MINVIEIIIHKCKIILYNVKIMRVVYHLRIKIQNHHAINHMIFFNKDLKFITNKDKKWLKNLKEK